VRWPTFLLVAGLIAGCAPADVGDAVLVNRASQEIKTAFVSVCDEAVKLDAVQPGERRELDLTLDCEDGFDVAVLFVDGAALFDNVGYITHGLVNVNEITVEETRIAFDYLDLQ